MVVNANPFTLGHRHLVEEAARQVDTLYVFVVREDRSAFPFDVRLRLVQEGTRELGNVRVLDTSRYAVSAVTFPAYFLAPSDDVPTIQLELDLLVFGQRIAPFFHVRAASSARSRTAPPPAPTTRRCGACCRAVGWSRSRSRAWRLGGAPVSASRVRAALRAGDLGAAAALVPASTATFLRSDEAKAVRARLSRSDDGRHV